MSKILIVTAHPDDEVLGCGGMIAKYSEIHDFYCFIFGEGALARDDSNLEDVRLLRAQQQAAATILGIRGSLVLDQPDNRFDSVPFLSFVKSIEQFSEQRGPFDYVFTHYQGDLNVDHQIVSKATQTAFRPQPDSQCEGLFFYEVLSSTEWGDSQFKPNLFIDISGYIRTKLDAFKCYESEIKESPHPRSTVGISNLAGSRGNQIGYRAAEGFMIGYLREGLEL